MHSKIQVEICEQDQIPFSNRTSWKREQPWQQQAKRRELYSYLEYELQWSQLAKIAGMREFVTKIYESHK
jgi:hypothetical protein